MVAERPYLSVFYGDIPAALLVAQCPTGDGFSLRRGLLPVFSAVANPRVLLPPGSSEHVCDIIINTPLGQPRALKLECTLGVLGAPPERFLLAASEKSVRDAMERANNSSLQTTDILLLQPQS